MLVMELYEMSHDMLKATYRLIVFIANKIRDDHVAAYSAQAAFFIIISFFPFIMLLLSIISISLWKKAIC